MRYSFGNMGDRCGEVTDSRYTKATGMAEILRRFDAPRSATIAFGDGDNDLEMMDFAEYGVAMGNATPALIAAADTVTDDINSDGLYNAFKSSDLYKTAQKRLFTPVSAHFVCCLFSLSMIIFYWRSKVWRRKNNAKS